MAVNRTMNRNLSARKTAPEPAAPPSPVEVKVNFGESDERYGYIRSKLDDIMQSIGQSYSDRLTKELIRRLEKTILGFHSEVITILDKLENLESEREKPKEPEELTSVPETEIAKESVESEISEWEKRLEERERARENPVQESDQDKTPEKKPKKGLFGRKK